MDNDLNSLDGDPTARRCDGYFYQNVAVQFNLDKIVSSNKKLGHSKNKEKCDCEWNAITKLTKESRAFNLLPNYILERSCPCINYIIYLKNLSRISLKTCVSIIGWAR